MTKWLNNEFGNLIIKLNTVLQEDNNIVQEVDNLTGGK